MKVLIYSMLSKMHIIHGNKVILKGLVYEKVMAKEGTEVYHDKTKGGFCFYRRSAG